MHALAALVGAHEQRADAGRHPGQARGRAAALATGLAGHAHAVEVGGDHGDVPHHEGPDRHERPGEAEAIKAGQQIARGRGGGEEDRGDDAEGRLGKEGAGGLEARAGEREGTEGQARAARHQGHEQGEHHERDLHQGAAGHQARGDPGGGKGGGEEGGVGGEGWPGPAGSGDHREHERDQREEFRVRREAVDRTVPQDQEALGGDLSRGHRRGWWERGRPGVRRGGVGRPGPRRRRGRR